MSSPKARGSRHKGLFLVLTPHPSRATTALRGEHAVTQACDAHPTCGRISPRQREKSRGDVVALKLLLRSDRDTSAHILPAKVHHGAKPITRGARRGTGTDPVGRAGLSEYFDSSGLYFIGPKPMLLQCSGQPQSCWVTFGKSLCLSGPRSIARSLCSLITEASTPWVLSPRGHMLSH